MFGIGGAELIVVVLVLLLFVGPDELPKVARTVSKGLTDLRRAANVAQAELQETMQELSREVEGLQRDVQDAGRDLQRAQEELAREPAPTANTADDEVTVIPRRKPAEATAASGAADAASPTDAGTPSEAGTPADPWQLAHRPPDDDVMAALDASPPPAAPEPVAVRDAPEPAKPAFRMPGGPIAGTVSRSAAAAPVAAAAAPPDPAASAEPTAEPTAEPEAPHA